MSYTITQVYEKYHLNPSTLRYYEKEGLLPEIKKDNAGRRMYTKQDLVLLDVILDMRNSGMGIANIKRYIQLYQLGEATLLERKRFLKEHQERLKAEIDALEVRIKNVDAIVDHMCFI